MTSGKIIWIKFVWNLDFSQNVTKVKKKKNSNFCRVASMVCPKFSPFLWSVSLPGFSFWV